MIKQIQCRLPLLLAIILHSTIGFFLFIRVVNPRLSPANFNTINAFTIDSNQLPSPPKTTTNPTEEKPKNPPIRTDKKTPLKQDVPDKNQLQQILLEKSFLRKRSQELKELKKEHNKIQRQLTQKQHTEIQRLLKQELAKEQQLLTQELNNRTNGTPYANLDHHTTLIHQAISSRWLKPENLATNDVVKILIHIGPRGEILEQQIISSSGSPTLERSAQTAVANASPLPIIDDTKIFDKIRKLIIVFKSDGIISN
jgi:TonB family protein